MNTNESGRSMVEMLGVLAIIGVLSVMGIAGYTQAMRRYKANEAVASISMAAVVCGTGDTHVSGFKGDFLKDVSCSDETVSFELADGIDVDTVKGLLKYATIGNDGKGTYKAVS